MTNDESLLVATTTVATVEQAEELARQLVVQRRAACVQVDGPVSSHYVWEGVVQHETEWRLTIKTTRAGLRALEELVHRLHPYELPQWWVGAPHSVSDSYARWVNDAVRA